MFTGIVEELGKLQSVKKNTVSAVLRIECSEVLKGISIGDSISTNGVCLTVTSFDESSFTCDVMHETLNRTGLGSLSAGTPLNLERAMPANGRFNGHIVSGHIDGVGKIIKKYRDDNAIWFVIQADKNILKYIVEKGSIAIDGISLTVAKVSESDFAISAIPHSIAVTNLHTKSVGDSVNLECDILGKYVEKLLHHSTDNSKNESEISQDFLFENGFF